MKKQSKVLTLFSFVTLIAVSGAATPPTARAEDKDEALARKLTLLLRSARAMISSNPKMIADPTTAGLKAADLMDGAKKNYIKATGAALDDTDEATSKLLKAIGEVFEGAVGGKYKDRWTTGVEYPGKFLPARFATEVSSKFSQMTDGKYVLRLTVPDKFLVNKDNKADEWESGVIEGKFLKPDWQRGKVYFENATYRGKPAYRAIVPEYYDATCLKCHGGTEGSRIHGSKAVGQLGNVGGAISVVITK